VERYAVPYIIPPYTIPPLQEVVSNPTLPKVARLTTTIITERIKLIEHNSFFSAKDRNLKFLLGMF
jgi:hypothetical protein